MAEDAVGDAQVGTLAEHVDDVGAQPPQREVEADRDQHADEQDGQRRDRRRRHDAVVDLHREQHAGEAEQVGDHRGDHDMAVGGRVAHQDLAQPVILERADIGVDARIRRGAHRPRHDEAGGGGAQLGERQAGLAAAIAGQHQPGVIVAVDAVDQRDLAVGEADDHRQPPAAERDRLRRREPDGEAGGAGEREDARVLVAAEIPLRGEARALFGDGQAIVAGDAAEQFEPAVDGYRRRRSARGGHSVTPRTDVPDRPKASRILPDT